GARAQEVRAARSLSSCMRCGCGEEDPELISPEARAARAVHLEAELELLDAVLGVPALAVDPLVNPLWSLGEVGYDEAGILLGLTPGMANDLGLDDHPTLLSPSPGGVAAFPVHVGGLATLAGKPSGLPQELLDRKSTRLNSSHVSI